MDLMLAHAYFLREDPLELKIMRPYAPLGLLYLSAYLKREGLSVGVFDATFQCLDDFTLQLYRDRPRIVGLYVNMMTRRNSLKMIKKAKQAGALVILGGPEPPAHASELLEAGADVIVVGEGELTLSELVPLLLTDGVSKLEQVSGILFRNDARAVIETPRRQKIKDLDSLPLPDRNAIDLYQYLRTWREHHGQGSISLITARGCPFKCAWCSHAVYGHSHRRRSPGAVVDEMLYLKERYQPDMLWIADDVFTINARWTLQWSQEMRRRGLKIPYECISRADCLSEPLLDELAATGCFRIWFGSESGSQRILDAMDRGVTVEQIQQATRLAQQRGIQAGLFVMLGYDGETMEDIEATVDHLKRTRADTFLLTVAYPIRGTTFHQRLGDRLLPAPLWETSTDRDSRFLGRPSDQFYRMALSYVQQEVRYDKVKSEFPTREAADALIRSRIARAGMQVARWMDGAKTTAEASTRP